jgi:hypothetical protein
MVIQFELSEPAASLLLRLMGHLRDCTGTAPDSNQICQSMIVDLLVDDAVEHGVIPAGGVVMQ